MKNLFIQSTLFVFFSFFIFSCGGRLEKGATPPDFKLVDTDGKEHQLSTYKGKVVMLHFWTDWCESCRAEFPRIQSYYSQLEGDNFELIAVNVGQKKEVSQEFKEDFAATFPMLADEAGTMIDLYEIDVFPTNYFIDTDGKIIRRIKGWVHQDQVEVILKQNQP